MGTDAERVGREEQLGGVRAESKSESGQGQIKVNFARGRGIMKSARLNRRKVNDLPGDNCTHTGVPALPLTSTLLYWSICPGQTSAQ